MWMDASGDARRRLDAQIAELQKLTPEEQQQADSLSRESRDPSGRHRSKAAPTGTRPRPPHCERARTNSHGKSARFESPCREGVLSDSGRAGGLRPGQPGSQALLSERWRSSPIPCFRTSATRSGPQVILVNFWSKSEPTDNSPRSVWLRKAKETFDFPAVAALLR